MRYLTAWFVYLVTAAGGYALTHDQTGSLTAALLGAIIWLDKSRDFQKSRSVS